MKRDFGIFFDDDETEPWTEIRFIDGEIVTSITINAEGVEGYFYDRTSETIIDTFERKRA